MPDTTITEWRFDRNYQNYEQVEHLLPEFERVLAELTAAGKYRYNDLFRGRIPGAAGRDEDTAIYLLQSLERERRQEERVAALLADGYQRLEQLAATTRFSSIILFSGGRTYCGAWQTISDGRLVPKNGAPYSVIPKGKRTHGYLVSGRDVLVKE